MGKVGGRRGWASRIRAKHHLEAFSSGQKKSRGPLKHEIFAELCPDVLFELDTYWAANYGENNPVEMVRRLAKRSPLLHLKEGPTGATAAWRSTRWK